MSTLGSTGIELHGLCLGGNTFGWTSDRKTSFEVLDAYTAAGGNFIDTADSYSAWVEGNSGGESETIIGAWLAARENRDRVVVATKVSQHPEFKGLSGDNVAAAAEASLRRLGIETIDLYYAHFDDAETPLQETAAAFEDLVTAGKIGAVGLSNYSPERVREWFSIARREGYTLPVALQPHYNLVHRQTYESGLSEIAKEEDLAVMPYFSLAAGFLTGKYRNQSDLDGAARAGLAGKYLSVQGTRVLTALDSISGRLGVDMATVALAWLRTRDQVAAPIASARSTEQLPALLAAAEIDLTADDARELTDASTVMED